MIRCALEFSVLVVVYCCTVGSFALWDLVWGAVLAGLIGVVLRAWYAVDLPAPRIALHSALLGVAPLALFVVGDILRGTWQVALASLGLRRLRPGIIAVPVEGISSRGIAFTGLLLTLSPGSILLDVDYERRLMWFHLIDARNPERERQRYQRGFQKYQRRVWP